MKPKAKKSKPLNLLKKPLYFRDIYHEWNWRLKNEGLDAIKPGKPSLVESIEQSKSRKVGVPRWASAIKPK